MLNGTTELGLTPDFDTLNAFLAAAGVSSDPTTIMVHYLIRFNTSSRRLPHSRGCQIRRL